MTPVIQRDWRSNSLFMRQNPGLVASGTGLLYMDPHCRPLYEMKPSASHQEIMAEFLRGHSMAVAHAAGIYQVEPCKSVGYREKYKTVEDLDLFFCACRPLAVSGI